MWYPKSWKIARLGMLVKQCSACMSKNNWLSLKSIEKPKSCRSKVQYEVAIKKKNSYLRSHCLHALMIHCTLHNFIEMSWIFRVIINHFIISITRANHMQHIKLRYTFQHLPPRPTEHISIVPHNGTYFFNHKQRLYFGYPMPSQNQKSISSFQNDIIPKFWKIKSIMFQNFLKSHPIPKWILFTPHQGYSHWLTTSFFFKKISKIWLGKVFLSLYFSFWCTCMHLPNLQLYFHFREQILNNEKVHATFMHGVYNDPHAWQHTPCIIECTLHDSMHTTCMHIRGIRANCNPSNCPLIFTRSRAKIFTHFFKKKGFGLTDLLFSDRRDQKGGRSFISNTWYMASYTHDCKCTTWYFTSSWQRTKKI